jgi:hypothetical protein
LANELLLVGSIPCETAEEVFRMWGHPLGHLLPCMPDGEVGDRIHWIDGQAYRVFNGHPDIETAKRPRPDNGVEQWRPRDLTDQWMFRVREGVPRVRFGDLGWRLGYARDAINSYFIFKTLKQEGVIPPGLRFMVALPTPESATSIFFRDPVQWDSIKPAYEEAMLAEVAKIAEKIPANDLAIQWDAAVESVDIEFGLPWLGACTPERFARYTGQFARLSAPIPEPVMLGYHACYGTLGGWPMVEPSTLANQVRFLNEALAQSKRRVNFVHLPMLNRPDVEYCAPLADLRLGDTNIYLGLIHNMESFEIRLLNSTKYLKGFGIAAPCGFGRIPPDELKTLLRDHLEAVEIVHKHR